MGLTISSLFSRLFGKTEIRILMLGFDNAGKTTILYKLTTGTIVTTIPTIGFNVETLIHKNIYFTVWDVGGSGDKIRPLWHHYYVDSRAVIFAIDSTDRERVEEAEYELKRLFRQDEMENAVLLVIANKQDLPNAMTRNEVIDNLRLNELSNHRWNVQLTSATEGYGLHKAMDWLANELAE